MTCNSQPTFRRQHLTFVLGLTTLSIFITQVACAQDEATPQVGVPQETDSITASTKATEVVKAAQPDRPVVSEAKASAPGNESEFHLFDGEWKLHSARYIEEDGSEENLGANSGRIHNGVCTVDDERLEYRVVKSDQRHALIETEGENGSERGYLIVERLEHVLFLKMAVISPATVDLATIDLELARKATDSASQSLVYEFWRIAPQRKKVVEQLESSLYDLNTLRQTGTSDQLEAATRKLREVTLQLEKLDTAPQIQSLTYQVLRARKAGKHDEANRLELHIPALSPDDEADDGNVSHNSNRPVPDAKAVLAAQTGFNDLETEQDLNLRMTDTRVELDNLKRNLGPQHPQIREAQDRLKFLQTLRSGARESGNNAPKQITTSRAQLEKERQSLLSKYDQAQQNARKAATDLRRNVTGDAATPDEALSMQKQLKQTVTAAFEIQQELQAIRLSIATLDLQQLRLKHDRRKTLADQVIERRMQQLLQDDELLWSQTKGLGGTTKPDQPQQLTKPEQVNAYQKATLTDPKLLGEWTLVQASESDFMALKPNSQLTVSGNRLQLSRYGQQLNMKLQTNTNLTPHQVSIVEMSDALTRFTGIYQIEEDVLTISWVPNDGMTPRPTKLLSQSGNTQIWARVQPLPIFKTPQELLSFFDSATKPDSPDFGMLMRLLTDDEADRFAGFLIASTGMMQRMMPLMMMAEQMGGADDDGPDLATVTQISALLSRALVPNAPPECVQAFRDLTKPDVSFMTGQFQLPMTNIDAFSEKLRLAGRAVGDSRLFTVQLMNLLVQMSNDSEEEKKDKPKPDWLVTQDGDEAIAINRAISKQDTDLGGGKLHLQRIGSSWKIARMIDDESLAEIAASATGPIIGTDEDGNKVPISSLFGMTEASAPTMSATPSFRAIETPQALNEIAPYTKIDKSDLETIQVMTDETTPISRSEVVGNFVNRRLKRGERITREMLVENPTTEQIVEAYLKQALNGEEVFRRRGFPSRTFPRSSQSVLDLPYDYDPKRFHSELPDWTQAYITAGVDRLKQKPTAAWSDEEFHVLWSLEPLVAVDTDDSPYDLQPLTQLMEDGLASGLSDEDLKLVRSPLWSSALRFGIAARLIGPDTELLFEQPVPQDSKQIELLRTMCSNKPEQKWIDQEQVRLAGLMQDRPLQTLDILLQGNWPENNSVAVHWLYALSTNEHYAASRSSPREDCPPPVDPLLLVLTMDHLAGESMEIDEHIAAFFDEPHPQYAFLRHLDDVLSSRLRYRDTALDALARIYQKTSSERLKSAIKKVAPAAPIRAKKLQQE